MKVAAAAAAAAAIYLLTDVDDGDVAGRSKRGQTGTCRWSSLIGRELQAPATTTNRTQASRGVSAPDKCVTSFTTASADGTK